ncbi:hypothetical protein GCM10010193_64410 [Kitasatospora atroaurantiaca]|uniref:Uncharacterized protein YndB with AHSA1/START domain n=1 Tax=Kitasatospora atroaurantiaca TaxID=285545 RepID=A0A561EM88_9ACTN|nr:SRPBCC family protein [Kitasatospora atroaurantiaca]TWE16743.1 uncharacterized protein YndB with AHSA1/START domain [Kitasatospora atroaurantiaca]
MTGIGSLEQAGDRWHLRFIRELSHPREKVWRAVTEHEHLARWFPSIITGEWAVGGKLVFTDPEGRGPAFEGEVLAYAPPAVLEFSWGLDVIRLELTERDGGCTLVLLDTLEELGKAARDGAGWHECLDLLAVDLDGRGETWSPGQKWAELHPGYVAAFGPEASTIGPPPGWEPKP